MKFKSIQYIVLIVFIYAGQLHVAAQTGQTGTGTIQADSLTLTQVLQKVMQDHPSVKQAQEALKIADANIGMAKAGYLPEVDITSNYSHVGPTPSIDFPGLGTFQLFPADNFDASVNIHQTIYDFGKTSNGLKLENENRKITGQNIDLIKQNLALKTIGTFYALVYYQEALRIKNDELANLKEHQLFIEKKQATGAATSYELLSTKVKISNTESQKLDLEAFQKSQWSVLNSLTGSIMPNGQKFKKENNVETPLIPGDSLIHYAFEHRVELALSKENETLAQINLTSVKTQNYPVISAIALGGFKNGYMPDLGTIKPNYVIGLGLKIPLFDSNRRKYNIEKAESNITSVGYSTDLSQRMITNEVIEASANCEVSKKKINQYVIQLAQAEEAYSLAQVSFKSGAITNLDLLDSETAVSESQLLLLKSKIDFIVNSYKLKIALGDKL